MEVSADLSVLLATQEWEESLEALPEAMRVRGFKPISIFALQVAEECTESSPLAQEYRFRFGQWPLGIPVWRLIVNGETAQPLATVACFDSRLLAAGSLVGRQCGNRFYGDGAWCPGGVAGGFWVMSGIWTII